MNRDKYTFIVEMVPTQKEKLDFLSSTLKLSRSEIVRMAIDSLTLDLAKQLRVEKLRRMALLVENGSTAARQLPLAEPLRIKRHYKKRIGTKRKRAGASNTGSHDSEVRSVPPSSSIET